MSTSAKILRVLLVRFNNFLVHLAQLSSLIQKFDLRGKIGFSRLLGLNTEKTQNASYGANMSKIKVKWLILEENEKFQIRKCGYLFLPKKSFKPIFIIFMEGL